MTENELFSIAEAANKARLAEAKDELGHLIKEAWKRKPNVNKSGSLLVSIVTVKPQLASVRGDYFLQTLAEVLKQTRNIPGAEAVVCNVQKFGLSYPEVNFPAQKEYPPFKLALYKRRIEIQPMTENISKTFHLSKSKTKCYKRRIEIYNFAY
ncbi:unnamed protein product [Cyprideis torosa]|uniref:Uncharacterized protein n=1 Tax=Cyprideis torosa TaxID=163714 RepID=A0A7R8W6H4_9CRUS|nr:unnamed protein product [Cyprideis torosa]CAG0881767.1 unnamed protein product [Cyprideis torosa]